MEALEKRSGNNLTVKSENVQKIQVISIEKDPELLTLTFCCKVPPVEYSDFFNPTFEKYGYYKFWNGIRRSMRKEFKFGEILLDDVDYPELLYRIKGNNSKFNQIVIDITFFNSFGPKWKEIINQDQLKQFAETVRDTIIENNNRLLNK